jgi:hypothetical protein
MSPRVTELGVADALGPEPESADALAKKVGANADARYGVVRLLASHGVFDVRDGDIGHTPATRRLKTMRMRLSAKYKRVNAL